MKEIKLIPDKPFHNYVDVAVMDFPDGLDKEPRKRCKVTVEFAEFEVEQLKKRGLDFEGAMKYYEDWLYNVIRVHLAQEWKCIDGWDTVIGIIKEKVFKYY